MMFILADGTMHAHTSQMPVGTYKKAHRHGADFHVFAVTGHGYSLLWYDSRQGFGARRLAARRACSRRPTRCSTSTSTRRADPARYLAVAFGSLRYPFTTDKRHVFMGMDVSVKDGGCQIEYEHQDRASTGSISRSSPSTASTSGMAKFIDERAYAKTPA